MRTELLRLIQSLLFQVYFRRISKFARMSYDHVALIFFFNISLKAITIMAIKH
jgi:hypothetical protein